MKIMKLTQKFEVETITPVPDDFDESELTEENISQLKVEILKEFAGNLPTGKVSNFDISVEIVEV